MLGNRLQSANNRTNLVSSTQKHYGTSQATSLFQLNSATPSKQPFNAVNAVIKTIHTTTSKPPPPTGLHLIKAKETENVLPNMPRHSPSHPQHLMVGTDYRAGRKIGKKSFHEKKDL